MVRAFCFLFSAFLLISFHILVVILQKLNRQFFLLISHSSKSQTSLSVLAIFAYW